MHSFRWPQPHTMDPLEQLQKLGDLRSQGIISDIKFSEIKADLLRQAGAGSKGLDSSSGCAIPNANPAINGLPTVSAPQVEAARAELDALGESLSKIQLISNRFAVELVAIQSELKSLAAWSQVRKISDEFPLGRYGTTVVVLAAIAGVSVIVGIGLHLSVFVTTSLVLCMGFIAAGLCTYLLFWRSDEQLLHRQATLQQSAAEIRRSVATADYELAGRTAAFEKAKAHYEILLSSFQNRRNRLLSTDWRCMRGIPFENFLCEIFRELGFQCHLTKSSGDQGVDLIASLGDLRLAIQAKGYAESVGNKAVQEAHAGMTFYKCNRAIVITNSAFTSSAVELAVRLNCRLIDGAQIPDLILGKITIS
jgi:HJR/Mrr/RecB family endonuclease